MPGSTGRPAWRWAAPSSTPRPRAGTIKPPRPRARRNQYQLGVAELLSAALSNTAQQVVKLVKTLPAIGRAAGTLLLPEKDEDGRRHWSLPRDLNFLAPRTAFNVAITNQRRFAARTVPLAEVKEIAKRRGVTLNDVVMATVAGGLREYLIGHRELPERPLSAAVPVSLRAVGDESANNQVSGVTMTLATDVADPLQRLKTIAAGSAETKAKLGRVKTAIPTDFPMLAAPWLMSGLASLFGRSRLANVLPPLANLVISNVPGIQQQLYFAGARIISYYPVSIPAHGMALNVTVQSYNGRLDYGLIGCRRAVPDIMDLADALLAEHRKLLALAREHDGAAESAQAKVEPVAVVKPGPKRAPPRRKAALNLVKAGLRPSRPRTSNGLDPPSVACLRSPLAGLQRPVLLQAVPQVGGVAQVAQVQPGAFGQRRFAARLVGLDPGTHLGLHGIPVDLEGPQVAHLPGQHHVAHLRRRFLAFGRVEVADTEQRGEGVAADAVAGEGRYRGRHLAELRQLGGAARKTRRQAHQPAGAQRGGEQHTRSLGVCRQAVQDAAQRDAAAAVAHQHRCHAVAARLRGQTCGQRIAFVAAAAAPSDRL